MSKFLLILTFLTSSVALSQNYFSGSLINKKCNMIRPSCKAHYQAGCRADGIYQVKLPVKGTTSLSCDMVNGGWTIVPVEYTSQPNGRSGVSSYPQSLGIGEAVAGYMSTSYIVFPNAPSDASSAVLNIYVTGGDGSWNKNNLQIRRVTSAWNYQTITWNNRASVDGTTLSQLSMAGVGWYLFDVSTYLVNIKNSTWADYGLNLPTGTAGDDVNMAGPGVANALFVKFK